MKKFVITVNMMMEMCMCRMCMISCVLFSDESSISEVLIVPLDRTRFTVHSDRETLSGPRFYFLGRCPV